MKTKRKLRPKEKRVVLVRTKDGGIKILGGEDLEEIKMIEVRPPKHRRKSA